MQQIKGSRHDDGPFYDQTNGVQNSSGNFLLCSCCWPSRRPQQGLQLEPGHLKQENEKPIIIYGKRFSDSLHVKNSPRDSLYLSMTDLHRASPRSQLEASSRLSGVDSINDQKFVTARTSRSIDGRRYKSMPELVKEIREELLGNQFEEVKEEFMAFFRKL